MSTPSTEHDTFILTKTYPVPPSKVFAAWSTQEAKKKWFGAADGSGYTLDFKVGGHEFNQGGPPGGPVYIFDAEYQEIIADHRIVYSYIMDADGTRISVSVTTIEFAAEGDGTRLTFTEQGVFLDGLDNAKQREEGTNGILDALGRAL